MRKTLPTIIIILIYGIAGLAVGYAIFGKVGGEYVDLSVIFSTNKNFLQRAAHSLAGIDDMSSKILWCGASGLFLGVILGLMPIRRR
jgi:hypothetical protein